MDHGRKIGKPEKPNAWTKRPSPRCSITNATLVENDDTSEDRRLVNWRKWLTDRKKNYKKYANFIDRDDRDLLMLTTDDYRRKVEMKEAMEMTFRPGNMNRAKIQSDPGFWVTPEFLPKRGDPNLPKIFLTLAKKQLYSTSELERVALPELTQQEKGLSSKREEACPWKLKRNTIGFKEKLSRKVKLFEAKDSEIKKLAVRGTKLCGDKCKNPEIPVIKVDSFDYKKIHEKEEIFALKIQDREIKFVESRESRRESKKSFDESTWSLSFRSSGSDVIERSVRLENRGNTTIRYRWRYGLQGSTLIPQIPRSSPFYFNKNEDLILPGQVNVLRVWFRSRVPCSATEIWTLVTDPQLSRSPLVFRFWGCCDISERKIGHVEDFDSVDRYLDRRIRDSEIHEIIEEILENVHEDQFPSPAYGSLFLESEIFQAKNPLHYYRHNEVQLFQGIYKEATSEDSPDWSLSLEDLRGIIFRIREPEIRNEILLRFNELCRQCLQPNLLDPVRGTEKSMVYYLLCSFFNKFETEDHFVRIECFQGTNKVARNEAEGDTLSSRSASRISQNSLTARRHSKKINKISSRSKTSSKTSLNSTNRDTGLENPKGQIESNLHRDIFYVRIRAMLIDTIDEICTVVDSGNYLKGPDT